MKSNRIAMLASLQAITARDLAAVHGCSASSASLAANHSTNLGRCSTALRCCLVCYCLLCSWPLGCCPSAALGFTAAVARVSADIDTAACASARQSWMRYSSSSVYQMPLLSWEVSCLAAQGAIPSLGH